MMASSSSATTAPFERSSACSTSCAWTGSAMRIAEATVVAARGRFAEHQPRQARTRFVEALEVRARVAAAAVRKRQHIRHAELLDDLECCGLLAFDPVGVEGVHECVRATRGKLSGCRHRLVERAAHLEHARPSARACASLPERDGAGRLQDERRQTGACRVRSGGRCRVACRRTDDRLDTLLERLRQRDRHPAVREGAPSDSLPPT